MQEWVEEFDKYVKRGYYSAWYKDNIDKFGSKITNEKSKFIREFRVSKFPELDDCLILQNGTLYNVSDILFNKIDNILFNSVKRIMVSNHDVYVEFCPKDQDIKQFKFVRGRLQYDEYQDQNGYKLYAQFKAVNYADYKSGRWYISFTDILRIINENPND